MNHSPSSSTTKTINNQKIVSFVERLSSKNRKANLDKLKTNPEFCSDNDCLDELDITITNDLARDSLKNKSFNNSLFSSQNSKLKYQSNTNTSNENIPTQSIIIHLDPNIDISSSNINLNNTTIEINNTINVSNKKKKLFANLKINSDKKINKSTTQPNIDSHTDLSLFIITDSSVKSSKCNSFKNTMLHLTTNPSIDLTIDNRNEQSVCLLNNNVNNNSSISLSNKQLFPLNVDTLNNDQFNNTKQKNNNIKKSISNAELTTILNLTVDPPNKFGSSNINHNQLDNIHNLKSILKTNVTPNYYNNMTVRFNPSDCITNTNVNTLTTDSIDLNINFNKQYTTSSFSPCSFSTTTYRKPTYTGLMTKWNSFVPHSYKVSTISSMVYRAIRICSTYKLLHEELEFIEFISILNKYPIKFIKSQIRKTYDRYVEKQKQKTVQSDLKVENINETNRLVFLDIPFAGEPTHSLDKQIKKITRSIDPKVKLQIIQRPINSISNYFPNKEIIPKMLQSHVVYKVDCTNCDASYIGKTIRHVSKGLREHGANFNETNDNVPIPTDIDTDQISLRRSNRNKNKMVQYYPKEIDTTPKLEHNITSHSAIKQHELTSNHKIDWLNFNILAKEMKHYQLLILESLLINNIKPKLNRTITSVPLIIYPEGIEHVKPKVKIKSVLIHTNSG